MSEEFSASLFFTVPNVSVAGIEGKSFLSLSTL